MEKSLMSTRRNTKTVPENASLAEKLNLIKTGTSRNIKGYHFYLHNNSDLAEKLQSESSDARRFLEDVTYLASRTGASHERRRRESALLIREYSAINTLSNDVKQYLVEMYNLSNKSLESRAKSAANEFQTTSKRIIGSQREIIRSSDELTNVQIYEPKFDSMTGRKEEAKPKQIEQILPQNASQDKSSSTKPIVGSYWRDHNVPGVHRPVFGLKDDEITLAKIQRGRLVANANRAKWMKRVGYGLAAAGLLLIGGMVGYSLKGCRSDTPSNWTQVDDDNIRLQNEVGGLKNDLSKSFSDLSVLRAKEGYYGAMGESNAVLSAQNKVLSAENQVLTLQIENEKAKLENMVMSNALNNSSTNGVVTNSIPDPNPVVVDISGVYVQDTNLVTSVDLPLTNTTALQDKTFSLSTYRRYSVGQGSRSSKDSMGHAGKSLGRTGVDLANLVTFSYATKDFAESREDDLTFNKPAKKFGHSFAGFFKRLGGPLAEKEKYKGLNLLTGALTWPGRIIGGSYNLATDTANLATAGMANNFINPATQTERDTLESGKHIAQSVLNVPRRISTNGTFNAGWDYVTIVPTELGSNVGQGEGISNNEDTRRAVDEKGAGYLLESGLTYLMLGETANELAHDNNGVTGDNNGGSGGGHITGGNTGGLGGGH